MKLWVRLVTELGVYFSYCKGDVLQGLFKVKFGECE